jgi:3'(2'), 5'-bisphosphate nucleotidase
MNLKKELETAIEAAQKAGEIINEFYALEIVAENKYGVDNLSEPVTIADRTASKIIVENLQKVFPGDGILSEEEPDTAERLSKNRVWIIDPLDGTRGFINKDGDFAVQIGLSVGGESVLGVVFVPAENGLYYAVKNEGAFFARNGETPVRLKVSDKIDFGKMNLAVSRNHRSKKMNRVIKKFGLKKEIRRGSVGLKVGLIAQRICDLYIHFSPRTKHWDTCAPEIILREAGGNLTDIFGGKIIYNTKNVQNYNGVLASNGAAHEKVVENLRPLLNEFGRVRVKTAKR